MLDYIADFFLFFSNIVVIGGFLVFFLWWGGRAFFLQLFCLTLMDMIINVALKGTFKIFPPGIPEGGYAFPSGHMQLTCVFYGWLLLHVRSIALRCCLVVLCIGQGMGLMHYHYHTLMDVIGGAVVAFLLIVLYRGALKIFKAQIPWILLCLSSLCMLYNGYAYKSSIPLHAIQSYEALLVLLLIERILSKNGKKGQNWQVINSI